MRSPPRSKLTKNGKPRGRPAKSTDNFGDAAMALDLEKQLAAAGRAKKQEQRAGVRTSEGRGDRTQPLTPTVCIVIRELSRTRGGATRLEQAKWAIARYGDNDANEETVVRALADKDAKNLAAALRPRSMGIRGKKKSKLMGYAGKPR